MMLQQRYWLRRALTQTTVYSTGVMLSLLLCVFSSQKYITNSRAQRSLVHHSDSNGMCLTPSRRCLHIWESPIRRRRVKGEKTQYKVELISKFDCDKACSLPFWKALKINNYWPKSILPAISNITWHNPAEVHKPLNYIRNIPSAGLLNVNVL